MTPHRFLVKIPMPLKKIGDIESLVVCKYLQFEVHRATNELSCMTGQTYHISQ